MHWYTVLNLNSHLKRRRWRWGVSQWCWGAFAGTTLRYNEHIRFCQLKKPQMWQFAEFSRFHMVSFTLPFVRESTGEYTPSHFLSSFILVYRIFNLFWHVLLIITFLPLSLRLPYISRKGMVLVGVTILSIYHIKACEVSPPVRLGFSSSIVVPVVQSSSHCSSCPLRACLKIAVIHCWQFQGLNLQSCNAKVLWLSITFALPSRAIKGNPVYAANVC